jgi:chemotaxis signal transduction protein
MPKGEGGGLKTTDATAAQAWCLVRIDTRPFAVALHAVAEIVEAEALVRLALCSPRVLGLCTYRRDLLPVIALDEGASTPDTPGHVESRAVVLILRGEHGTWGIRIDRGGTVVAEGTLDERVTIPEGAAGAVVIGSITRGGTSHAVIDAEATWRNVRDAIELWYKGDLDCDRRRGA